MHSFLGYADFAEASADVPYTDIVVNIRPEIFLFTIYRCGTK